VHYQPEAGKMSIEFSDGFLQLAFGLEQKKAIVYVERRTKGERRSFCSRVLAK
jgi:hypothetical protein